jgi:hypothetical protein
MFILLLLALPAVRPSAGRAEQRLGPVADSDAFRNLGFVQLRLYQVLTYSCRRSNIAETGWSDSGSPAIRFTNCDDERSPRCDATACWLVSLPPANERRKPDRKC